jgi:glycosyltransferase involved in cell wall biosynthesis
MPQRKRKSETANSAVRSVAAAVPHEVIAIDDHSIDSTIDVAKALGDRVVLTERKGQAERLAIGMELAKYDAIITIDAGVENDPRDM